MTSISTEDKGAIVEIGGSRELGLYIFAALLVLIVSCSIAISQPYISDTDASTYVIIPLIMLPVFALFMLKQARRMVPAVDGRSIAAGALLFAALIVLSLDLRAYMGTLFFGYRVDALLIPIAIAALALLLYGRRNLRVFGWIALYSLFASPLLLYPVVNANLGFASLNTWAIFHIAGPLFHGLSFSPPVTLILNGNAVSIGNTCIGIGALIGIGMLLAPIAYLVDGTARRKALWIACGLLLMLALNFIRMFAIAIAWFIYGPSNTILSVHAIAGQIIFYLTLVVMVIMLGKAGLRFPKPSGSRARRHYSAAGIAAAAALSTVYFAITLSYLGAAAVQGQQLAGGILFTWTNTASLYSSHISFGGGTYSAVGRGNESAAVVLVNASGPGRSDVVLFADGNSTAAAGVLRNASAGVWKEYLDMGGIAYVYQAGNGSYAYFSAVPYYSGAGYHIIDMYIVGQAGGGSGNCLSAYDYFYDTMANIALLNAGAFGTETGGSYCSVAKMIR